MDLTTVLFTNLQLFSNGISLDDEARDDALAESLAAFTAVVEVAVPSYLGLQMMIGQNGHPVTLTRITPHRAATTSLRLPLTVLGPRFDAESRVTLYAATAGAFVDLAADLGYALHLRTCTARSTEVGSSDADDQRRGRVESDRRITLDADMPPSPLTSGMYELSGMSELSTVNRAIGVGTDRRIILDADLLPSPLASGVSGLSELSTINRAIGVLIGHGQHPDQAADTLRRDGLEPHSYAARLLERGRADRDTNSRRQVVTPSSNVDDAEHRPSALRWRRVWRLSTRIPLSPAPDAVVDASQNNPFRAAKQPVRQGLAQTASDGWLASCVCRPALPGSKPRPRQVRRASHLLPARRNGSGCRRRWWVGLLASPSGTSRARFRAPSPHPSPSRAAWPVSCS